MSDGDDTVVIFPGGKPSEEDFDPETFLELVKAAVREDILDRVVVACLDVSGRLKVFSSSADIEFTHTMFTIAKRHVQAELHGTMCWGDVAEYLDDDYEDPDDSA
jgi:hypothetical protein